METVTVEQTPLFTENDYLQALLKVVASLAKETTGKSFCMRIKNDQGDFIWCDASLSKVDADVVWFNPAGGRPQLDADEAALLKMVVGSAQAHRAANTALPPSIRMPDGMVFDLRPMTTEILANLDEIIRLAQIPATGPKCP